MIICHVCLPFVKTSSFAEFQTYIKMLYFSTGSYHSALLRTIDPLFFYGETVSHNFSCDCPCFIDVYYLFTISQMWHKEKTKLQLVKPLDKFYFFLPFLAFL